MDAPTPPPSPDAARWLAAAAARIEADPALLDALSDADVQTLLAAEGGNPSGVAVRIRRRVREQAPGRRRWRWPATVGALALASVLAVFLLRPAAPDAAASVLAYRTQLAALGAPPTKGTTPTPLASGARALLAAAQSTPPDTGRARQAALSLAEVDDPTGEAIFFAGLAFRLAGDEAAADAAFRRVPDASPYAGAARENR